MSLLVLPCYLRNIAYHLTQADSLVVCFCPQILQHFHHANRLIIRYSDKENSDLVLSVSIAQSAGRTTISIKYCH